MSNRRRQIAAAQTDFVEPTGVNYAFFIANVYPVSGTPPVLKNGARLLKTSPQGGLPEADCPHHV
jgi:hypothetical protein